MGRGSAGHGGFDACYSVRQIAGCASCAMWNKPLACHGLADAGLPAALDRKPLARLLLEAGQSGAILLSYRTMRKALPLFFLLFAFSNFQSHAASVPAFTINVISAVPSNSDYTLGWEFTTTQQITVRMLGLYNDGLNGLIDSYSIGIWSSSGTLLGMATVPSGTGDLLVNQFRYVPLNDGPLLLPAGQTFDIGALYLDQNDLVAGIHDFSDFATDPAITFQKATYASGSTLTFPNESIYTSPGYFGPNFLIDAPEHGTFTLLSLGLFSLVVSLHARSKAAIS